ncbi:MAG: TIGR03618 family F420-dependent PPOX class oxidoreductase [bacterium]|nr:TIGR03618 family F420-dependent PPOX class oxidoreductase [bacterium]MYD03411.1 TIGR03618 family F420-dependent PPOX class oxidoreductase [Acidimicrobiia bacterium]
MLDEIVLKLARGPNFASLATMMPNGEMQVHMMWVDADDDHVLINTEIHRPKYQNLMRDGRATVMIPERGNPWHFVEIRGEVAGTVTGPEARSHIDALAHKYLGMDSYPNPITTERVIVKIAPRRVVMFPPS